MGCLAESLVSTARSPLRTAGETLALFARCTSVVVDCALALTSGFTRQRDAATRHPLLPTSLTCIAFLLPYIVHCTILLPYR